MKRSDMIQTLEGFIPSASAPLMADLLIQSKVHLTITRRRSSKYGDYRHPFGNKGHRISVNHNLNPYAFLITLVHELAHLYAWEKHRNKVSPHGKEWKQAFQVLMDDFTRLNIFPDSLAGAIDSYMRNPGASSCSDPGLMRALRLFDKNEGMVAVEELPENALFRIYNGMILQRGPKQRTRFKCKDTVSHKHYLVSGHMMVRSMTSEGN